MTQRTGRLGPITVIDLTSGLDARSAAPMNARTTSPSFRSRDRLNSYISVRFSPQVRVLVRCVAPMVSWSCLGGTRAVQHLP
jgi:hypothetical protein